MFARPRDSWKWILMENERMEAKVGARRRGNSKATNTQLVACCCCYYYFYSRLVNLPARAKKRETQAKVLAAGKTTTCCTLCLNLKRCTAAQTRSPLTQSTLCLRIACVLPVHLAKVGIAPSSILSLFLVRFLWLLPLLFLLLLASLPVWVPEQ